MVSQGLYHILSLALLASLAGVREGISRWHADECQADLDLVKPELAANSSQQYHTFFLNPFTS
jgi:hypothetical protein